MRIFLRNRLREPLFEVTVDPHDPPAVVHAPPETAADQTDQVEQVALDWDMAVDDHGHLRKCPACGCRELFVRKDFPQKVGLIVVAVAGLMALVLFAMSQVLWAFAVLGMVVVIDAVIYLFTPRCLVCYRCRSEFRQVPIGPDQEPWELAIGEKYRPVRQAAQQQTHA